MKIHYKSIRRRASAPAASETQEVLRDRGVGKNKRYRVRQEIRAACLRLPLRRWRLAAVPRPDWRRLRTAAKAARWYLRVSLGLAWQQSPPALQQAQPEQGMKVAVLAQQRSELPAELEQA